MPRKPIPSTSEFPYHVTARCVNREWFDLPMPTVWSIFEDYLFLTKHEFNLRLHAFVLMGNHFHLMLSTPDANISRSMQYLMRETSKEITRLSGRINQTWGSRHYKTLITSDHYYSNCYKYLYRNPIRASLVKRAEDYRFSSLNGLIGGATLYIPLEHDTMIFDPNFDKRRLEWISQTPLAGREDSMRLALRRSVFKLPRNKKNSEPNPLESELL